MENKNDIKTLFSNTFMLYLLKVSGYIFPLITFPYLTRTLGASKYGIIVFVYAVIVYFRMFVEFGFTLSGTKTCSLIRNDKNKLGIVASSIIQGKLVLCLMGFVIIIVLVLCSNIFKGKELIMVISYLQLFPEVFIADYLFRGLEKMSIITYRSLAINAIYTLAILLLVNRPDDYYLVPIIAAANNVIIVIWSWLYIYKSIGIRIRIVSLIKMRDAIKESASYFMANIASTAYNASNIFVLGLLGFSNSAIGQFGVANNMISMVRSMFSPIADSLYPYMVAKKNYKLIKLILLIGCPIVIVGTAILFVWADYFVVFISGEGYLGSVPIFRIMLPLVVITLPMYLLGYSTLGAMGKVKEVNLTVVYASLIHVSGLAVLYFIDNINFISVAILTVFSESTIILTRLFYISKARIGLHEKHDEKTVSEQSL